MGERDNAMRIPNGQCSEGTASQRPLSVILTSPFPPPYGGMAIQAKKLFKLLRESGFDVVAVRTNPEMPHFLKVLDRIAGVRTVARSMAFLINLQRALRSANVVYFLTGFFNFFFWVTYPGLILIKLNRTPVILNGRGGAAKEFFDTYGWLLKPIVGSVDAVTVPSQFLGDAFRDAFGIHATIVPNIADLDQFGFKERKSVRPYMLVTRNLEPIYNVSCVVEAFCIVRERYPHARLGIAGDGSERRALDDLVSAKGLKDSVVFYGSVEHGNIKKIYDEYDISVNASNVDNFPGTILEAFACGLPVVSTNAGGIPYLVKNGETGILVECGDYEAMADRVIELVERPKLATHLIRNGKEECKKYTKEYVKAGLLSLLEDIGRRSTGGSA